MRRFIKNAKTASAVLINLFIIGSPVALLITALIGGEVFTDTLTVVVIGLMFIIIGVYARDNFELDRSLNPNG